jgi:hypothetical protein
MYEYDVYRLTKEIRRIIELCCHGNLRGLKGSDDKLSVRTILSCENEEILGVNNL